MKIFSHAPSTIEGRKLAPDLIAPAVAFVVYLLWINLGHASAYTRAFVTEAAYTCTTLVGVFGAFRGWRARASNAWSPRLLSLGLAAYAVGDLILIAYRFAHGIKPASSCADLFLLAGACLSVAGLLLFPSRRVSGVVRVRVFLDGMMVMAALVTFTWFFTLGPTILDTGTTPLGRALNAIYPMMDLVMMFCVVALSSHVSDPGLRRSRNLLCFAVLAAVVSDVAFLYLTIHQTYAAGSPWDVGYVVAPMLSVRGIQALCEHLRRPPAPADVDEPDFQKPASLGRALLPYALVPAVAMLAFHVWSTHVQQELALGVYVAGAVLTLLILIRQVIAIVENNRLYGFLQEAYRELQDLATTDGMTGLWNHRTFQERFAAERTTSKAGGKPVALLLIDVDRFKAYNDAFGHPAGDEALRLVADVLRRNVRPGDTPARYGGEEFAAILPGAGIEEAVAIAERIRAACEAQAFPHRTVTLSIGVVSQIDGEIDEMIEAADQALYVAKNGGRNLVCREGEVRNPLPAGWSVEDAASGKVWRDEVLSGPAAPLLRTLMGLLDLRDGSVVPHSDRAARICLRLAEESMRQGTIERTDLAFADLYLGALLHDIGKVGVPDAVLHAADVLGEADQDMVRRHPVWGAELLTGRPEFSGAIPIVRSHHERWDGTGYPDGLVGEAIPLGARLFALADAVDAMWSGRPYRTAATLDEIEREIRLEAGRQFDPEIVDAFLSVPLAEWAAFRREEEVPGFDVRRAA